MASPAPFTASGSFGVRTRKQPLCIRRQQVDRMSAGVSSVCKRCDENCARPEIVHRFHRIARLRAAFHWRAR